jgi:Mrp family chromosome partitioning ATPase
MQTQQTATTNWPYIIWRDRIWVLSFIVCMLISALVLSNILPRDYVARVLITSQSAASIKPAVWLIEQQSILSDELLSMVQDQLSPVSSEKLFSGFQPLKLSNNLKPYQESHDKQVNVQTLREKFKVTFLEDTKNNPIGLVINARSSNPAEAVQLARLMAQSYKQFRNDISARDTAQKNGRIRTEIIQKRKALFEAQAILAGYIKANPIPLQNKDMLSELRNVKAEWAEIQSRYGFKHPIYIETKAKLDSIENDLRVSNARGSDLISQTIESLTQDVRMIETDLNQFIKQHGSGLSFTLQPLDRDVTNISEIYIEPDHDFDRSLLGSFALLGLLIGCCFVALKHKLSPSLQSSDDMPQDLKNTNFIGKIERNFDEDTPLSPPDIIAYKTVRHDIRLRFSEPKLLVVTSDISDHSLTQFALDLGRVSAKTGDKILVLEANWLKPSLYQHAHNTKQKTMIDYLIGNATIDQVLCRDDPSGVHIVFGGEIPMTSIDLLSGQKFANLLLSFRQIYDLVILIAPPVGAGADALVLSALADVTLLAAIKDQSKPKSLLTALNALQNAKVKDIATLWVG